MTSSSSSSSPALAVFSVSVPRVPPPPLPSHISRLVNFSFPEFICGDGRNFEGSFGVVETEKQKKSDKKTLVPPKKTGGKNTSFFFRTCSSSSSPVIYQVLSLAKEEEREKRFCKSPLPLFFPPFSQNNRSLVLMFFPLCAKRKRSGFSKHREFVFK